VAGAVEDRIILGSWGFQETHFKKYRLFLSFLKDVIVLSLIPCLGDM
jgi:hypothetical protein